MNPRATGWLFLAFSVIVCGLIYWPGLRGGFTYDDRAFLLGNLLVQVTSLRFSDWTGAAMSFPDGAHQGRWLGMLTFAANHYFTGLDPFWLKLTNLGIHLCNGVLLFLALRALLVFTTETRSSARRPGLDAGLVAAVIACLWLVLPINLTAVLYVSQRLEALSNTFVFLGLWWYLRSRLALWRGQGSSAGLWLSLLVCTGIGVTVKESAVLLPLYALCAEFVLTGLKDRDGRWSRRVLAVYGGLLLVPLIIGLVWLSGWIGDARSYGRSFDVFERLLTEARVLMHYVAWTLTPSLDALTLYHDDILLSRGMLDPPTTLAAIAVIVAALGIALWQRVRRPLLALGILWFFAGHVLTGTIIPLMLAFEHRNYFPSVGLLLAVTALLALEDPRLRGRALALIASAGFGFYSFTTALRAMEWSDPQRLTLSQSAKRPDSPGAQYDRSTAMLTGMTRPDGTSMYEDAMLVLDRARKLPGAGILFEQRMITEAAKRRRPIDPEWWAAIEAKLVAKPANASDTRSLLNLNQCYTSGLCGNDPAPLKRAYDAALAHGNPRATLLSTHAEFAWYVLHDRALAEREIRQTVADAPNDINARRNLVILLIHTGQLAEARAEVAIMQQANHLGIFDRFIDSLVAAIDQKEAERAAGAAPQAGVDEE